MVHSQITKDKISKAKLANPTRYWLGKKRSPETLEKIKATKKEDAHAHCQNFFLVICNIVDKLHTFSDEIPNLNLEPQLNHL